MPKGELKPEQFPKAVVEALRREGLRFWYVLQGGSCYGAYFGFWVNTGGEISWILELVSARLGVSDHFVSVLQGSQLLITMSLP